MKRTALVTLFLMVVCFAVPSFAAPALVVNCNAPGPLSKINNVLKLLNPAGPNTLVISGTCKENIVIQGFDRLTLVAKPGAVLTDASGGQQWAVVLILDSRRVSIQGFTISGGNVGVSCDDYSLCRLRGNTFDGTAQRGVDVNNSELTLSGDVIQNGSYIGLYVNASNVQASNVTIQANSNGISAAGSTVTLTGVSIHNNTSDGVFVNSSAKLQLIDSNVSFNSGNGITVADLTDVSMVNDTVTGNGQFGVWFGDESVGFFVGGSYRANGYLDISCGGQYSLAKNIAGIYGTTDCPVPQAASSRVR